MKDQELEKALETIAGDLALISANLLHYYSPTNNLIKNGVNWTAWQIKGFTPIDEVDYNDSDTERARKDLAGKIQFIGGREYVSVSDAQEWRAKNG